MENEVFKKYTVEITRTQHATVEVVATSQEEAFEKAREEYEMRASLDWYDSEASGLEFTDVSEEVNLSDIIIAQGTPNGSFLTSGPYFDTVVDLLSKDKNLAGCWRVERLGGVNAVKIPAEHIVACIDALRGGSDDLLVTYYDKDGKYQEQTIFTYDHEAELEIDRAEARANPFGYDSPDEDPRNWPPINGGLQRFIDAARAMGGNKGPSHDEGR